LKNQNFLSHIWSYSEPSEDIADQSGVSLIVMAEKCFVLQTLTQKC